MLKNKKCGGAVLEEHVDRTCCPGEDADFLDWLESLCLHQPLSESRSTIKLDFMKSKLFSFTFEDCIIFYSQNIFASEGSMGSSF